MSDIRLVGAVFPDRPAAAAALGDLSRVGIADRRIVRALRTGEEYLVDGGGGARFGRGVAGGGLVGAVVGAAVGLALVLATRPDASLASQLVLGLGGGVAFGAVLGAYAGLLAARPPLWEQEAWEHVPVDPGQVLVVVSPGDREEEALTIFSRRGATVVDPIAHRREGS